MEASEQWEYTHVSASTNMVHALVDELNNRGVRGWEVVGFASADKTIGLNAITAIMRRRIVPLDPPADLSAGWRPDPSGRHELRFWNASTWTFGVKDGKRESRDAPSQLPPYEAVRA